MRFILAAAVALSLLPAPETHAAPAWARFPPAAAPAQAATLTIADYPSLPAVVPGVDYRYPFTASGGTPPYEWSVTRGLLPAGIRLDAATGLLAGLPAGGGVGNFQFELTVRDAAGQHASKIFTLALSTTLALRWIEQPKLDGASLSGSAEVQNLTSETLMITFVATAVAGNGRATAVGYQHFELGAGRQTLPIKSTLGPGNYFVHIDVKGESEARRAIYSAMLETPRKYTVAAGIH